MAKRERGIEIFCDSLNAQGIHFDIPENSPCLKNDRVVVRNQLLHTVYQLHLGELVLLQANYFECPEAPFWNVVKQVTEQSFYRLRGKMKSSPLWEIEYHAILKADWPLKALLRMRLEKNYLRDGLFSQVSNPLVM